MREDLTGKKFGRLTVLKLADKESLGIKSYGRWWKCRCDCGNISYVKTTNLTSGLIRSCGCLRNEKSGERLRIARSNSVIDLTGQRFGKLTVIKRAEDHITKGGYRMTCWLCRCDCGKEVEVYSQKLRSGKVKSCGCAKNKTPANFKDLTGQKIGKLTVLERAEDYITKGGFKVLMWKCRCDCGKVILTSGQNLRLGRVTSCGCAKEEK